MRLFHFGKKNAQPCNCTCTTGNNISTSVPESCCISAQNTCCGEIADDICCIKILGAGCKSCHEQLEHVKTAVHHLKLNTRVEHITDMEQVAGYGAIVLPAIVINKQLISCGRIIKPAELEKLLQKYIG